MQKTIVCSIAVVFGLCGTALARPDWSRPLPVRQEIQQRIQVDGRAQLHEMRAARQERPAVTHERPSDYRPGPTMAQLPLKTQIALKMQNGGEGKATDDVKKDAHQNPGSTVPADQTSKASPTHGVQKNGQARPLSRDEKESLCRHTGVCLPTQLSSDDPSDKSE